MTELHRRVHYKCDTEEADNTVGTPVDYIVLQQCTLSITQTAEGLHRP